MGVKQFLIHVELHELKCLTSCSVLLSTKMIETLRSL